MKPLQRAISRIRNFSRFSFSDLIAAAGPTLVVVLALGVLAYLVVDPAPPRRVVLVTGQENSAYEALGKQYAQRLARHGIDVVLQRSLGSQDNLQRLEQGRADIGFVQSGSTDPQQLRLEGRPKPDLISLGSLFTEPVWLFMRAPVKVERLADLRGKRINLGPEGTGVPRLFRQLLDLNGVEPGQMHVGDLQNTPAVVELLEGRIDALVFSAGPDDLMVQMLLQTPGIALFDFPQAEAYARRLPFLTHVALPRGIVDVGKDIPAREYQLVAPTATLVARSDLHPALVQLFVQTAAEIHGGPGWFQQQGQFPSPKYTEIDVAPEAAKFYKDGPPVLQRYMSFWVANFLDRMWVVIVALAALVLPLSRVIPPVYVWRVRSRIYRWYGELRSVEQALEHAPDDEGRAALLKRLDDIEARVNQISIPLAFADALYGLRSHINFVRRRVGRRLAAGGAEQGTPVADADAGE
jgi:TRAP transporter TAXI family solute receptor